MVIPLARRIEVAGIDLNLTAVVQRGLGIFAILIGALIVYRVGKTVINRSAKAKYPRAGSAQTRSDTTRGLLLSIWSYVVVLGVLLALLALLPATLAHAVTVAAISGVVIALTANALMRDVVAGFSILLEGQLAVGDRVRLFGPDVEGVVEGIGLRITVIKEDDGSRVFVPNGAITAIRALAGEVAGKAEERRPRGTRGGRTRQRAPRAEKPAEDATPKESGPAPRTPRSAPAADPAFETRGPSTRAASADEGEAADRPARPRSSRGGRRRGGSRRPPRTGSAEGAKAEDTPAAEAAAASDDADSPKPAPRSRPPQKREAADDDVLTESPWSIE